eukprot:7740524-Alexandrium_andersonii.AAC.1
MLARSYLLLLEPTITARPCASRPERISRNHPWTTDGASSGRAGGGGTPLACSHGYSDQLQS